MTGVQTCALPISWEWVRRTGTDHLSLKVGGRQQAAVIAAQNEGFLLMTTHQTLLLPTQKEVVLPPKGVLLRDGKPEDLPACEKIAYETSYPFDRFNMDPTFTPAQVSKFYGAWTRNSFNGRAKWFLVLEDDREDIVGTSLSL